MPFGKNPVVYRPYRASDIDVALATAERELLHAMKKLAARLKADHTQAQVGAMLGVAQNTVSLWFRKSKGGSNSSAANASAPPDSRVKIPPKERARVAERVTKGEGTREGRPEARRAYSRERPEETAWW